MPSPDTETCDHHWTADESGGVYNGLLCKWCGIHEDECVMIRVTENERITITSPDDGLCKYLAWEIPHVIEAYRRIKGRDANGQILYDTF